MVLEVRNDNVALGVKSDAPWSSQALQVTAVIQSVERESRDEVTVGAEELNTMIARVSDQYLRLGVDSDGPRVHELRQFFAVRAELMDENASVREDLNAMIIFINDNDAIVLIRGHPSW